MAVEARKAIAFIEATFSVVVWGASFVATKVALRDVSPVTVVWVRFAIGVAILGLAMLIRHQFSWPGIRELGYFTLLGFLGITFHQWLQSTALLTSEANTTAWIVAATPVFMALLGWLFLKEKLKWLQVFGIALAGTGVLVVVTKGNLASMTAGGFGAPGDFLVMISAVNWAVFSALSRPGLQRYPATWMMFYVMLPGWLFTSLLLLNGPALSEITHLSRDGWLGVGFLGVFCSGLAYIAWYDALQILPASQLGVFLYLEPLVAAVVAFLILNESLTISSLLGGGTILLGVWMVNRREQNRPKQADNG
jgi:drug/metabolite transporter (DMT)-like permease